jgi:hypothetical protein
MTPTHPDQLVGDELVARTQGDALQLADLVRDHGPETLDRIISAWGSEHTRRVCIALAAAVDPGATLKTLWGWLDDPVNRATVTVPLSGLWKQRDPHIADDRRTSKPRRISPETRARMANRARALAEKRRSA